jgi:hypothetical protein
VGLDMARVSVQDADASVGRWRENESAGKRDNFRLFPR